MFAVVRDDEPFYFPHACFDRGMNAVMLARVAEVATPLSVQTALYAKNGDSIPDPIPLEFFDVD